jgi:hypothetical protein
MEYRATFISMLGLTVILSFVGVLSLYAGVYGNSPAFVVVGVAAISLLIAIRIRFRVRFDGQQLSSSGFFSTKTVRWAEITSVVRMADAGYPKDRFHGPYVYEFQTATDSLQINFKLFPLECMTEVMKRVERVANR